MLKLIIIILVFFGIANTIQSQTPDEQNQLAQQYYKNKEFEKAATIFSDLYSNQKSKIYFTYYLNCLIELKDFETAEKILKKEIRRNNTDLSFKVDLGYLYKIQNLLKESDEEYMQALKLLQPDNNQIITLANAYLSKREFGFAEQTYLKGRKMLKDVYGFNFELANIYQAQLLYDKMINEYLDLLEINDSYLQTVQNRLQSSVYADKENNLIGILKSQLIKRIQKNPDRKIFSELLIWLYLQDKDYENAFIQCSALDKRLKEDGSRLIELANQAVINKDYDVALKAYQYVIDKGKSNSWYVDARSDYMNTLYNKIIEQPGVKKSDVEDLEKLLQTTLNELGRSKSTFSLIKAIAFIQAFYLNKADEASLDLEKTLASNILAPTQIAECKLLMGDILLFNNDIWGATIYYAQVEKANENEPVGHEAKFRKAKLAYYSGDFLWAQAQLDVLKASTSKLIANDAFTLSLLISENITADSTGEALQMYSRAEWQIFKHTDSLAIITLDSILRKYSSNEILDDSYFKLGELFLKKANYQKAISYFDTVSTKFSVGILSDDALFKSATIYEKYMLDNKKAMEYYQKILTNHPGSIIVNEARKKYRFLRGDKLQEEIPAIIDDTQF
jgi:tetratricopeptide (TPR) repeat protein